MRSVPCTLLVALCLGTWHHGQELSAQQRPGAPGQAQAAFSLVPGVVVDPAEAMLYTMLPSGDIAKVSVETGQQQWTSPAASKPLTLVGGLLMAQVERSDATSKLSFLDAARGTEQSSVEVTLPDGVVGTVAETLHGAFRARGLILRGEPVMTWEYSARNRSGWFPGPQHEPADLRRGAARIDLSAGRATLMDPGEAAVAEAAMPPSVQAWADSSSDATVPRRLGALVTAAERQQDGRVILKRWNADSGDALPDATLASEPALAAHVSVDGRHLLLTRRTSPGEWDEYTWSIHDASTGALVGDIEHHRSSAPFFVAGDAIVFVQSPYGRRLGDELITEALGLKAIVLGSGALVWEQQIRDTAFYGQIPR